MRRAALLAICIHACFSASAAGEVGGAPAAMKTPDGYRLIEATAASVNGEVLFLSDIEREACFFRCGAYADVRQGEISRTAARDRLIADTLIMQEQRKLGLGAVDNAALEERTADAVRKLASCPLPCAKGITAAEAKEFVRRRLLVKDFLAKRVAVFIEVKDDEIRLEIHNRRAKGVSSAEELSEEGVRKDLYAEKSAREIGNWYSRATSKSRIFLSPLEDK